MRSTCRVAHILNLGANQIGEVLVELVVLGLHILMLHSLRQDVLVETPAGRHINTEIIQIIE